MGAVNIVREQTGFDKGHKELLDFTT